MAHGDTKLTPGGCAAAMKSTRTPLLSLYRPIGLKAVLAACSVQPKEQGLPARADTLAQCRSYEEISPAARNGGQVQVTALHAPLTHDRSAGPPAEND